MYLATVSDGSQVAVKVIHPHVKAQIASDLRLLRFATSAVDKVRSEKARLQDIDARLLRIHTHKPAQC